MKAAVRDRYGGSDVVRVESITRPMPVGDQALVRVRAASINTADLDHLQGRPPVARVSLGMIKPKTGSVGFDMSGEVEAVGESATTLRPGDSVWADLFGTGQGAFAEYVCASEKAFVVKPQGLTFELAASLPHSGILAVQALRSRGLPRTGQSILINGAGGCVGPFAIQIAKAFGAEVTGVDDGAKLDFVRSVGADHVIDYTIEDYTRGGARYDMILDIAANHSVVTASRTLKRGGVYVQIARNVGGFMSAALVGGIITMLSSKRAGVFNWVPNRPVDLDFLADLIEDGKLAPVIDRKFSLPEVRDALRHVEQGRARGKVIITI